MKIWFALIYTNIFCIILQISFCLNNEASKIKSSKITNKRFVLIENSKNLNVTKIIVNNINQNIGKNEVNLNNKTVHDLINLNLLKYKNYVNKNNPNIGKKISNINNTYYLYENIKNLPNKNPEKSFLLKNKNQSILNSTKNNSILNSLIIQAKNYTVKNGFFHEFATSFSLNFFSEIGDKSFIAVFLLTNQVSWVTLFLVASFTEIVVNFISVVIGYNLKAFESIYFILIYVTIFTTFLFGFLFLKEAIYIEEEKQNEISSGNIEENVIEKIDSRVLTEKKNNLKTLICNIFKIFWVVLLSELGDRSQIVTIILSTHHDPVPVFLGTAIAHVLGVLLSILLGNVLSSKISNRIMNFIAGFCFLGYGIYVTLSYFINKNVNL